MWHFVEQGPENKLETAASQHPEAEAPPPLILLHGIGMSNLAWQPVMPLLARDRRVIAFDVAGFGQTPPLPAGTAPTTANLVKVLAETLREMGIQTPVDIAGNSMGGYMALEAAKQGLARRVVAISPAGLWRGHPAIHVKWVFMTMRRFAQWFPRLTAMLMHLAWLRELLLCTPISWGSRKLPAEIAVRFAENFARCPGFEDTFANAGQFTGGKNIEIPITIAFGTLDWLLTPMARQRDELPAQVRWISPSGWGHVPMWKDPAGVARLILEALV